MQFNVQLTNAEKKSIFERALKDAGTNLYTRLAAHGVDPDSFVLDASKTHENAGVNEAIQSYLLIKRKLDEVS